MRLSVSVLIAFLCHGVMFEVVTAVLARAPRARVASDAVEMEIVSAKPDPIADARASAEASMTRQRQAASHPRPARRAAHPAGTEAAGVRSAVVAEIEPPDLQVSPAPTVVVPAPRPSVPAAASAGTLLLAKPRYRMNPAPEYPIGSRRRREEGVVLLSVAVDASGAPSTISLSRTSGYPLLDHAALDAVRRWSFEPARAGGIPVFSTVIVPVRFSLADGP